MPSLLSVMVFLQSRDFEHPSLMLPLGRKEAAQFKFAVVQAAVWIWLQCASQAFIYLKLGLLCGIV